METKRTRRPRFLRVLKVIVEIIGVLFFAGLVFVYWATKTGRASDWARVEMLKSLHDRCDVDATFGQVKFDPFPPTVEIDQLRMKHADGRPLLEVDDAIATLQILPLFAQRIELDRVFVLKPKASIEIQDGRILDLPKCVEPPNEKPTSAPIVLGIRELVVEVGSIDLAVDKSFRAAFSEIGIGLAPRAGSGGSSLSIDANNSQVWIGERLLPLHRLRFQGQLEGLLTEPRVALLDRLEVELARVKLDASGSIDLLGPVYDAKVNVNAPLDAIHDFLADFPATEGLLSVGVRVQGTAANPHGVGRVALAGGKIDQFTAGDDAKIDFAIDRRGADISMLDVRVGEGQVTAKGRIDFDRRRTFPVRLETTTKDLSMGRLLDSLGIHRAWVDWRASGEGRFAGTILKPTEIKGTFDYRIRDFHVFDGPWDRAEARADPKYVMLNPPNAIDARGKWTFNDKGVSFTEASVTSGDTSATAETFLSFNDSEGLRVRAHFPAFDFKDLGPIGGVHFAGKGVVSGGVSGPYGFFSGGGVTELDGVQVAGIPFGHARADINWHDDFAIDLSAIRGKLGETEYGGGLSVLVKGDVPFAIKGQITKGRVEDVLIPFGVKREEWGMPSGQVTGTFELVGPILRLNGPIDLELANGQVLGEIFESGHIGGRLENGAVVADDAMVSKHGGEIHGNGRIDPFGGEVHAHARAKGMTLQMIDLMKATQLPLDADMALELGLVGNLNIVTGTLTAAFTRVVAGPVELADGRIVGKVKGRSVSLKGRMLGDALKVEGDVELGRGLPYRAQLDLREFDAPRLVAALNGHLRYRGLATGRARLSGSLVDWPLSSGEIQLEKGEFETGSVHLETANPASFTLRSGVLETKRVALAGPSTKLTAEGKLGSKILDLKVVGKIDLGIAEVLSPAIERVGGTLFVDSAIGGTPANLNLVGTGRIDNGILQWRGFYSRLSAFSASLSFSQSTVLIDKAEGRWADGKVDMTGNLLIDDFRVKNVSLQIGLEDAYPHFSYQPIDLRGVLNGSLSMEGTPSRLVIRGDLDVTHGYAQPKLDLAVVGKKRVAAQNVYDPAAEILDLDISMHAKEPVRVKNPTLEAEMKGDLRLTGTNQRFGMLGSAALLGGGHAIFLGRDYEVQSGTIDFQDRYRFNPRYDIWVQAEACSARIRVNLAGTLDKLDPTYSSNPAMDEANIVNCLLFGVKRQDEQQATPPLWQVSGIGSQVRKVLPIDDIDVTPEFSSVTHTYEPRVLVAKDLTLFGGTARLEYSTSTAKSEDRRFALRYRMTPQLTLQGSWVTKGTGQIQPQGGDLGLDLKYRWEW